MGEVAFVTGATGYTGRAVVDELAGRGLEVHAHVRPDSPRLAEHRARFSARGAVVDATPWARGAMAKTLARIAATHVYFLIGTTRRRQRAAARSDPEAAPADYERVDYGLASLLIGACLDAGTAPTFLYLSSLGAREGARNAYLAVRWRVEQELRASGLAFVIARPSFISGPDRGERRPLERGAARITDAALGLLAGLGARGPLARYGSMRASELARALVRLAGDPAARGRVFFADAMRER